MIKNNLSMKHHMLIFVILYCIAFAADIYSTYYAASCTPGFFEWNPFGYGPSVIRLMGEAFVIGFSLFAMNITRSPLLIDLFPLFRMTVVPLYNLTGFIPQSLLSILILQVSWFALFIFVAFCEYKLSIKNEVI
jgi:hypothetical protein